ncbi:MAG TPA: hypothetical protein VHU18_07390 [Rhizomicrobium sp.]|jgi:hypothetical protein|nr:hypothetical protein [Rhizomicrobium sp.]
MILPSRRFLPLGLVIATSLSGFLPNPVGAKEKLTDIRSVAVVSLLGNEVDMQTIGMTKFEYKDYKLHIDPKLDDDVRDFVTNALQKRLTVKNDVSPQAFSGVKSSFSETLWDNIGTHIRLMSPAPDVDALVVIYPNATNELMPSQLAVTHQAPFLFHGPIDIFAAGFAIGVFDAKTGERIDFGTGRFPQRGYIAGFSPPWERCPDSMWAESEGALSPDQKGKIRQELWSLITRSAPYALTNAGLISASEADELAKTSAPAGDSACESVG